MIGCIWSCPTDQMLRFPIAAMIRFCHNHGLLQIVGRPQWRTVRGGAKHYVTQMLEAIDDARLATPVRQVRRLAGGGVDVSTDAGTARFDAVVMACHSDQSLALLADPSEAERQVLGAIRYHANRAVLHTDRSVLPRRERAWAAWNYERAASADRESASVCLHYLLNDAGTERFDAVVMACHSDQSLALLADPSEAERQVLGAIRYHANRAVLHTDRSVLPRRERAWAAWNYERATSADRESASVCLHYLLNRLQPLPFMTPVIVSLNPSSPPSPASVQGTFDYAHPVFDAAAIAAQARLPSLQGARGTWFCGAWTGFGFHEDGLASGLAVATQLSARRMARASAPSPLPIAAAAA